MITMSFRILALMLGITASVSGIIGLLAGCCIRIGKGREKKHGKNPMQGL